MANTVEERRWRLGVNHHLAANARVSGVAEVADDLVALHSSDPVTVFLSVAARMSGASVDAVERALYVDRSVIRHHAMRRTLWVSTPAVGEWMHAATTRKIAAAEWKKSIKFLDGDEAWLIDAVDKIVALLEEAGPKTTREITGALPGFDRKIRVAQGSRHEVEMSALSRALLVAGFNGAIMRTSPAGSWVSSQYAWATTGRWTDVDFTLPTAESATELVRLWLERFGPGTLRDIQWWTGMTKTAVTAAFSKLDATEKDDLWALDAPDIASEDPGPWVAVLPGLDPTAMGWKDRDWYLPPKLAARVTDRNGNIGPTIWADGEVVGGWAQRPDGVIATEIPDGLSAHHKRLLKIEIDRLQDFVGEKRFRVRFPSPNQGDLLQTQ